MFSTAEEVIFALRTQGMSQKGIVAQVRCSLSTVSRILKKDFPAPVNNGGRPKKTSPQDDCLLKRIAHSNHFKSTTSITHSPVERDNDITCFKVNNLPAAAVPWFFKLDTLH